MNKLKLIRELARDADVSRAEAADAVDELTHRLLQVMRRLTQPEAATLTCAETKGKRQSNPKARRKGIADDQSR